MQKNSAEGDNGIVPLSSDIKFQIVEISHFSVFFDKYGVKGNAFILTNLVKLPSRIIKQKCVPNASH